MSGFQHLAAMMAKTFMADYKIHDKTENRPARPARRWGHRLLGCLGAICLLGGIVSLAQLWSFQSHAVVTVGKVVFMRRNTFTSVREKYTGSKIEQRTAWIPVIEFHTTDGRGFQFEGTPLHASSEFSLRLQEHAASSHVSPPDLSRVDHKAEYVGDWVQVRYDARHPEGALINDFSAIWFTPLVWLLSGAVLTTIAAFRAKRPA